MKKIRWLDVIIFAMVIQAMATLLLTFRYWGPKVGLSYLLAYEPHPDITLRIVELSHPPTFASLSSVEIVQRSSGEVEWHFFGSNGTTFTIRTAIVGDGRVHFWYRRLPVIQSAIDFRRANNHKFIRIYNGNLLTYIILYSENAMTGYFIIYNKN